MGELSSFQADLLNKVWNLFSDTELFFQNPEAAAASRDLTCVCIWSVYFLSFCYID